eukprot:47802-Alexandrium_andersonii.AAC.1
MFDSGCRPPCALLMRCVLPTAECRSDFLAASCLPAVAHCSAPFSCVAVLHSQSVRAAVS